MGLNHEDFLEGDRSKAVSEYRAVWACISRMEEKLIAGDLKEVKLTSIDLLNSIREIENLKRRKENNERLEQIVQDFAKKGIDLSIVTRVV